MDYQGPVSYTHLLTACGGGKSDAPAAGTQAAGSEAAGSEAAGAEGDTIKLGVIGPLTGPAATYGIAVQNGADLAVKEINAAGGVDGMMFELKACLLYTSRCV